MDRKRHVNDTIPFSKLIILSPKPIGTGGFGAVFKALHVEWGCKVAFKELLSQKTCKDDEKYVGLLVSSLSHTQSQCQCSL